MGSTNTLKRNTDSKSVCRPTHQTLRWTLLHHHHPQLLVKLKLKRKRPVEVSHTYRISVRTWKVFICVAYESNSTVEVRTTHFKRVSPRTRNDSTKSYAYHLLLYEIYTDVLLYIFGILIYWREILKHVVPFWVCIQCDPIQMCTHFL